ncbi:hypothetical protein GDO81_028233 [Engystomops pustulosus]|uniref:Uncharacterized protein n=1 Tax=Engystomops pustulosus TaxID=76066 RepID=A0AAV6YLE9_ENGPU|nr:hypothetical protein GDO81_028233 [Engystomops pustulosus]
MYCRLPSGITLLLFWLRSWLMACFLRDMLYFAPVSCLSTYGFLVAFYSIFCGIEKVKIIIFGGFITVFFYGVYRGGSIMIYFYSTGCYGRGDTIYVGFVL